MDMDTPTGVFFNSHVHHCSRGGYTKCKIFGTDYLWLYQILLFPRLSKVTFKKSGVWVPLLVTNASSRASNTALDGSIVKRVEASHRPCGFTPLLLAQVNCLPIT